jgi:hypothetical protein
VSQGLGGDDLELASLDFLGDADRRREEARKEMSEAGADGHPASSQEGADQTDSVWVCMDTEGRVQGIEISRHWRGRMEPGAFAAALFEAYVDAVRKLINRAAVAALASRQEAEVRLESDLPSVAGSRTVPPRRVPEPQVDEREWLAATWDLLAGIDDQLRRIDEINRKLDARDRRTTTLVSPQGYLTARIEGQAISEISGDAQRIRTAGDEQLRLEALALFRAATDFLNTNPSPQ